MEGDAVMSIVRTWTDPADVGRIVVGSTKKFGRRPPPHFPKGTTADLTVTEDGATAQWWCSGWEIVEWPNGTRELRRISR
jgi:hypothetical protein